MGSRTTYPLVIVAVLMTGAPASAADKLTGEEEAPEKEGQPTYVPDAPEASDQELRPVEKPPPEAPGRLLDAGLFIGALAPVAERGSSMSYSTTLMISGFARIELLDLLGLRLTYTSSEHDVGGAPKVTGIGGEFSQPALGLIRLGARLEPTWVVEPWLRLYGVFGIAWGRLASDGVKSSALSDDPLTTTRGSVFMEYSAGLGVVFDVIPRWMALGVDLSWAEYGSQTGSLLETVDDITTDGRSITVGGLPRLDLSWTAAGSIAFLM